MTRLAVVTDVHADVHALRDALVQIDQLGVDQILCCGDIVDYGLFPEETIALLRERRVTTIRGNHDRWATQSGSDVSGWDLTSKAVAYLESLPTHWRAEIDGVRVVATHARPGNDMKGIDPKAPGWKIEKLLNAAEADVLCVGHTHAPFIRRLHPERRFVLNPGALLRSAPDVDVATPGTFAILELAGGVAAIEIRRAASGEVVMQHRVASVG